MNKIHYNKTYKILYHKKLSIAIILISKYKEESTYDTKKSLYKNKS